MAAKEKRYPSLRLHKGTGQGVVTLNGRDYYLGLHGTDKCLANYKRLIGEYKVLGKAFGVTSKTVGILADEYLDYCASHYPATQNSESVQVAVALRYIEDYRDKPADSFGPLALKSIRDQMVKHRSRGKPLSRVYVNKMVDRIRRMFKWGVSNELVSPNTYVALKTVQGLQAGRTDAVEVEPVKPVNDSRVNAVLGNCTEVVADMIRLQRLLGCRPGELVRLRADCIDTSGPVWLFVPDQHKSKWRGQERFIYIGPKAQLILQKYLKPADLFCFRPSASEEARRGKPRRGAGDVYTSSTYGKAVYYACVATWPYPENADAKVKAAWRASNYWTPNQLRHSAATAIRRLHGLEAAQVILGHTRASTTEIYADVDHSSGRAIALKFG